ncbi:MAG: thioredoxin domain-containing protein [Sphingomonadaceae bacterium]
MNKMMILATASALTLAGCDKAAETPAKPSAAPVAAPAGSSWTEITSVTPDGGMLMGNPAAPVKLVEYGALSCPHCAKFSMDSAEGLKALVAKGTVSYELRTFLIHPQDVPASLLARCNGAGPFFAIAEQMFATQNDWLAKSSSITAADQQSWATMTPNQVAASMADKLGLVEFVQQRGIPAEKAKACLADAEGIKTLEKIAKVATDDYKISGTPTFIINGQIVPNVTTWADLSTELKKAGA